MGGNLRDNQVKEGLSKENCMNIAHHLKAIQERVALAAKKAGRNPQQIEIIAVSKKQSVQQIKEAVDLGQLSFGESYVQELQQKSLEISEPIRWHFIGKLQKNKINKLPSSLVMLHSIDSFDLALALEKRREEPLDCLVEISLGEEKSKSGIAPESLFPLLEDLNPLKKIRIRGLMIIPPYCKDPQEVRPYFRQLKKVLDESNSKKGN